MQTSAGKPIHKMQILLEKMACLQLFLFLNSYQRKNYMQCSCNNLLALARLHEYIHICLQPIHFKYYLETFLICTIHSVVYAVNFSYWSNSTTQFNLCWKKRICFSNKLTLKHLSKTFKSDPRSYDFSKNYRWD
jgi:hypothetical protein